MIKIKQSIGFFFLVTVGCIQMVGDLTNIQEIKGIGLAIHVSPAPKVFTTHQGFETFSSQFFIHWTDLKGVEQNKELTPEIYGLIKGPYNRRNVYGAALSYGPVLSKNPKTKEMFSQISNFAFCGNSSLVSELGLGNRDPTKSIRVELVPRATYSNDDQWRLQYEFKCSDSKTNGGR